MAKNKSTVKLKLKEAICTLHSEEGRLECAIVEKLKVPVIFPSSMYLNYSFTGNEKEFKLPNVYTTRGGNFEMALLKIKSNAVPEISPFPSKQLTVQLIASIKHSFMNYLVPKKINPSNYKSSKQLLRAINTLITEIIPVQLAEESLPRFRIDEKNFIHLRNGEPGKSKNFEFTDAIISVDLNSDIGAFFHFSKVNSDVSEVKADKAFIYNVNNINYSLLMCNVLSESIIGAELLPILYTTQENSSDVTYPAYIALARERIGSIAFTWKHPSSSSHSS